MAGYMDLFKDDAHVRLPAPEEAAAIRWLMSRDAARRRDELGAVFNRMMLLLSLLTAIQ